MVDDEMVELRGSTLTADEAAALEKKLVENPQDFRARRELLGYYFQAQFRSPSARQSRQKQVLWMIEHHPDSTVIPSRYTMLDPILDGQSYEQGKTLWLKAVESHPQNTAIIGNAAEYFVIFDKKTAEDLLKKAQALEPESAHWSQRLGFLYSLEARSMHPGTNSGAMAAAELKKFHNQKLAALEKAVTPGAAPDFDALDALAMTAFDAGEIGKARNYATELLSQAQSRKEDWNYGNAIQHGNIVLGRVALLDGKVEEAKKFLREAGNTPGSPQLGSFGPNMSLAKDLLEKGETNAVLEYFQQCGKFWKMAGGQLDTWATDVKDGRKPNFGANLDD